VKDAKKQFTGRVCICVIVRKGCVVGGDCVQKKKKDVFCVLCVWKYIFICGHGSKGVFAHVYTWEESPNCFVDASEWLAREISGKVLQGRYWRERSEVYASHAKNPIFSKTCMLHHSMRKHQRREMNTRVLKYMRTEFGLSFGSFRPCFFDMLFFLETWHFSCVWCVLVYS